MHDFDPRTIDLRGRTIPLLARRRGSDDEHPYEYQCRTGTDNMRGRRFERACLRGSGGRGNDRRSRFAVRVGFDNGGRQIVQIRLDEHSRQ